MRLGKDADPELRLEIEEIAKSGERAAELTRQLLALSRRQTLQATVFDLNHAVSATEGLLKRLLGTNIRDRDHTRSPRAASFTPTTARSSRS